MPPAKIRLFNDSPDEMFFVAISCNLEDYKFIHFMNKERFAQLRRLSDLIYFEKEEKSFSLYHQIVEDLQVNEFIIKNKSAHNDFLIPKLKTTDYILIIDRPLTQKQKTEFLETLESVSVVFIATEIDVKKIKTIHHIVEDLELSLMNNPSKNKYMW